MTPTPKAKMGRALLVFVFFQLFFVLVCLPVGIVYLHGVDDLSAPVYRTIFTLGFVNLVAFGSLGYMMWTGYGWARWTASFLLFAMAFIVLTYVSDVHGPARLALIGGVIYALILAAYLAFSTAVDQFIREQERFRKINV